MNFLAHLVLSPRDEEVMAGNFFGDLVKGQQWKLLPPAYAQGVLLHRRIDSFVDQHEATHMAKKLLPNELGLFKGVLLDMYWDHFLSRDFDTIVGVDRNAFARTIHTQLLQHSAVFGPKASSLASAMQRGNWLLGYADFEALEDIFKQMALRFPYANPLGQGMEALTAQYAVLHRIFCILWEQLIMNFESIKAHGFVNAKP